MKDSIKVAIYATILALGVCWFTTVIIDSTVENTSHQPYKV